MDTTENKFATNYCRLIQEIKLEAQSRSGLSFRKPKNCTNKTSFDLLMYISSYRLDDLFLELNDKVNSNLVSLTEACNIYKDEFINTFMILLHITFLKRFRNDWD